MPQKSKYSAEKKIEIIDKYMKGIKTSGQIISEYSDSALKAAGIMSPLEFHEYLIAA